jgi:N-acyl-D-amino-acid deacylase
MQEKKRILLTNGTIVDGTGKIGWKGSVLIEDGVIKELSPYISVPDCEEIDCSGKVIAPGFIDAHSHNDWFLHLDDVETYTEPFIRQGMTTFITGNCGYGVAGIRKDSAYHEKMLENPFRTPGFEFQWSTMDEYFELVKQKKTPVNFATLVGHGTVRASIKGFSSDPLTRDEMSEMLDLMGTAMDQGAVGASIGLQYEPGMFVPSDELREVFKLAQSKNKILTTHMRALSSVSGSFPVKPFGTSHLILALDEMINFAKETGARLQISHLIFVGESTWKDYDKIMKTVDDAIASGVDLMFDTYSYPCGASVISVVIPEWFMKKAPGSFTNKSDLSKLRFNLNFLFKLLGFGFNDIQIAYMDDPEMKRYIGKFIPEIASDMGVSLFDAYIKCFVKSNGKARVLQYKFLNDKIIEELMKHPASLFMTDSWVEKDGLQNPASCGCFPRFLQIARERKVLSLEQAVNKMTKATADRFCIKDRGVLKEGAAADITVFNWDTVRDNNTLAVTNARPSGIEHVFINGSHVLNNGELIKSVRSGMILK